MQISSLKISNYRSLANINIPVSQFLILIGRNNAGKSNILSAINLLLEGSKTDLSERDFYCQNNTSAEDICIEATISGVGEFLHLCTETHRVKIEPCIENDSIRIRRIAKRSPLELGKLEIWQPAKSEFSTPTGIDAAFKQFLPEIIYIEAFKDPSDEAQSSARSNTILSKLLKQIVEQVSTKISVDVSRMLLEAQKKFNVTVSEGQEIDERPEELKRVQQRISQHVQEIFAGSDARLIFKLPDLDAMMSNATIELRDHVNGPWTSPLLKGQGFQRTLYVALLQALAEELRYSKSEDGKPNRPFILLFEEPEVFLHPSLQREIGNILEKISKSNQVIIVTHSSFLVTPGRLDNVTIVRQQTSDVGCIQSQCLCPDMGSIPESSVTVVQSVAES